MKRPSIVQSFLFSCLFVVASCLDQQDMVDDQEQASTSSASSSTNRQLLLAPSDIPSRRQWDCNFRMQSCCSDQCSNAQCDGYCGEVSLQEALLYYGAYVSQGWIRRIRPSNDKTNARDVLIATPYPNQQPDLLETARTLGLQGQTWYARTTGLTGVKNFVNWTKGHLQTDTPVAIGVIFYRSSTPDYDHIVTATNGITNGLEFNDHYSRSRRNAKVFSMPYAGQRCWYAYCFSRNMYGVAMQKPPAVSKANLARLKVATVANSADMFGEPNWTCSSKSGATMVLEASVAYPHLLDPSQQWFIAVTFRGNSAQSIRDSSALFGAAPVECYALATTTSSVQLTVQSDAAVYTRVVQSGHGCS